MNYNDYFIELEKYLNHLSYKERLEAISYYQEFSAEANIRAYEDLVREFGTPRNLASTIYSNSALEFSKDKKETKSLKFSLIALLTLPLSFPILISIGAILFGLIISLVAILFSLVVSVIAVAGTSIYLIVTSFFYLASDLSFFFKSLGGGLLMLAMSVVAGILLFYLIRFLTRQFTIIISNTVRKVNENAK